MHLVFNELSETPLATSLSNAEERVRLFIKTFQEAEKFGFEYIRFDDLSKVQLMEEKSLALWFSDTTSIENRALREFFWSSYIRKPYIPEEDEGPEEEYGNRLYFLNQNEEEVYCQGLAIANIYNTLSISFFSDDFWGNVEYSLIIKDENEVFISIDKVYQVAKPEHLTQLATYIEESKEAELIESELKPEDKKIKLRDDHGKDVLMAFSKKLVNSVYVEGIVNSLPFNAQFKSLIKKISSDGIIEIVLHWTDKGIGVVVKTTGRNLKEVKAIAKKLEGKFDK